MARVKADVGETALLFEAGQTATERWMRNQASLHCRRETHMNPTRGGMRVIISRSRKCPLGPRIQPQGEKD